MSTTELRRLKQELEKIEKAYEASELTLVVYREKRDAVKAAAWAEAQKVEEEYYQRLAKIRAADDLKWEEYHAKMAAAEKAAQEARERDHKEYLEWFASLSPEEQAEVKRREQQEEEDDINATENN
jgi:hypothetical protein